MPLSIAVHADAPPTPRARIASHPRETLVPAPRIVQITVQPPHVEPGELASLCVQSVHARKLFITGSGVSRWSLPIACVPLHPARTTIYTVTALGENGRKIRRSVSVRVIPTATSAAPSIRASSSPSPEPTPRGRRHRKGTSRP